MTPPWPPQTLSTATLSTERRGRSEPARAAGDQALAVARPQCQRRTRRPMAIPPGEWGGPAAGKWSRRALPDRAQPAMWGISSCPRRAPFAPGWPAGVPGTGAPPRSWRCDGRPPGVATWQRRRRSNYFVFTRLRVGGDVRLLARDFCRSRPFTDGGVGASQTGKGRHRGGGTQASRNAPSGHGADDH